MLSMKLVNAKMNNCRNIVYTYCKENTIGYREEKNQCSIVAFSQAFDIDYQAATYLLTIHGKKKNQSITTDQLEAALSTIDVATVKLHYHKDNKISLRNFISRYKNGIFLVAVGSHLLVVKNGVIYDHSERLQRRVKYAWRILGYWE